MIRFLEIPIDFEANARREEEGRGWEEVQRDRRERVESRIQWSVFRSKISIHGLQATMLLGIYGSPLTVSHAVILPIHGSVEIS